MIRSIRVKKLTNRITPTGLSAITIIAFVVLTTIWQVPQAAALDEIRVSREISAPVNKVWAIVSDIDNEAKYWSIIKNIKNINRVSNTTEREVTVQAGPGGDTKTHQLVTINPEQFVVQTNITEGPITGSRLITLNPSAENNATTRIDAVWEIDLSGIPLIGKSFAKDNFQKTTEDALSNIAAAAVEPK
jgi:uncharacterized protein YndB with AHSA1/START domain